MGVRDWAWQGVSQQKGLFLLLGSSGVNCRPPWRQAGAETAEEAPQVVLVQGQSRRLAWVTTGCQKLGEWEQGKWKQAAMRCKEQ